MLGTGSCLLSASQPGARAERVVHPLPRGAQIAQGLVARSARTERAPARLRQRRLADALGPRAGMTRPPSHSRRTARFCSGLAPAHRVRPRATYTSRLDTVPLMIRTPRDRRGGTSLTMR